MTTMMIRAILLAGAVGMTASAGALAAANEPNLPTGERAFNFIDSNKDGKITLDEMRPRALKRVLRLDADNDGTVTAAEIDAYLNRQVERRKNAMLSHLDADNDAKITEREIDAFVGNAVQGGRSRP
jgi:EF hand domain-containing protein